MQKLCAFKKVSRFVTAAHENRLRRSRATDVSPGANRGCLMDSREHHVGSLSVAGLLTAMKPARAIPEATIPPAVAGFVPALQARQPIGRTMPESIED